MTIDTIKEVLSKIMSINRNLNGESLRSLLVASGWDKQDIEEGLKIFEYYSGKTPNKNNLNNIIEQPQNKEDLQIVTNDSEIKEVIDETKQVTEDQAETIIENSDNILSSINLNIEGVSEPVVIENIPNDITQEDKQKIQESDQVEKANNQKIDEGHIKRISDLEKEIRLIKSNNIYDIDNMKPASNSSFGVFIIMFNSILFILLLIFIFYIVLI